MSGNGAGRIRCLRMRNFTRVNPQKWHFNVNIIYSAEIPGSGQNTTNIKSQCILTGNIAELSHVQCNFGSWFSEPAGLHLGVIGWREALQESPPDFMGKTWENPWFPVDFPFQSSVFLSEWQLWILTEPSKSRSSRSRSLLSFSDSLKPNKGRYPLVMTNIAMV